MVDIGTGDGAFVYQLAKKNPHFLVIGIDPCHENLIDVSSKVLKKPSKGGLKNALFVLASVESLPYELNNKVDHIYINFPWGSLLQGVVLADEIVWDNIKRICKPNALIEITFGYDVTYDKKEVERLKLPLLDNNYFKSTLIPRLEQRGFRLQSLKKLSPQELQSYSTSWAKKLTYGQERNYYHMVITIA